MNLIDQQQPYRNEPFEGRAHPDKTLGSRHGWRGSRYSDSRPNRKVFPRDRKSTAPSQNDIFQKQSLSLADQETFTLRFGEFGTDAYTKGMTWSSRCSTGNKRGNNQIKDDFWWRLAHRFSISCTTPFGEHPSWRRNTAIWRGHHLVQLCTGLREPLATMKSILSLCVSTCPHKM